MIRHFPDKWVVALMVNFFLRKTLRGNLNEAVSLVEIDIT